MGGSTNYTWDKGVAPLGKWVGSCWDSRPAHTLPQGIAAKLQGDVGVTWQPRNWGGATKKNTTNNNSHREPKGHKELPRRCELIVGLLGLVCCLLWEPDFPLSGSGIFKASKVLFSKKATRNGTTTSTSIYQQSWKLGVWQPWALLAQIPAPLFHAAFIFKEKNRWRNTVSFRQWFWTLDFYRRHRSNIQCTVVCRRAMMNSYHIYTVYDYMMYSLRIQICRKTGISPINLGR